MVRFIKCYCKFYFINNSYQLRSDVFMEKNSLLSTDMDHFSGFTANLYGCLRFINFIYMYKIYST